MVIKTTPKVQPGSSDLQFSRQAGRWQFVNNPKPTTFSSWIEGADEPASFLFFRAIPSPGKRCSPIT